MNILQANLKHLYQRKGCWVLYLVLALLALLIVQAIPHGAQSAFLIFPAWIYLAAIFTAPLQIEVINKPFSWCLPGHSRIPAKFLFITGMCVSLLWSTIFFFLYPSPSFPGQLLMSLSVFFLATIIYWLGVWVVFRFANCIGAIVLVPMIMVTGGYLNIGRFFEFLLVDCWYSTVLLGVLVNFFAWHGLTRPGLARKYCCKLWLGAFDGWNKEKMQQFNQARQAQKKQQKYSEDPLVDDFFLKRISPLGAMNTSKYILGSLYSFSGLVLSRKKDWLKSLISYALLICFLGYMSFAGNIIFLMPGLMVTNINLGARSSLLISGGRKERFYSALTLAVAVALSITAIVTLIASTTFPLQAIMPELTIKGHSYVFQAMELRLFVVPLVMIPITFTFSLIFYKHPRLVIACVMLPFFLLFQISIFGKIFKILPENPGPIHIAILIITCWAIFTAVLHHICKRRCLVR